MMSLLPALALFAAWLGLAAVLVAGIAPRRAWRPMPAGVALAVALAAIQTVLSVFALAGLVPVGLAVAVLATVALVAWRARQALVRWRHWRPDPMAGLIVLATLVIAAPLLLRPHASYDVLSYHLPLAERAWTSAGVSFQPGNYYSRLPMGAAVLEAPLVSRGAGMPSDLGVRVLILAVFAACVLAAGDVARKLGASRPAALIAMMLVATHPLAWKTLLNAYTDGIVALYGLGGIWLVIDGAGRRRRWHVPLALCGALTGSAMAVKFSAIGVVALPLWLMVVAEEIQAEWRGRRGRWFNFKRPTSNVCIFSGILAYSPWMLRAVENGLTPGDPIRATGPGWSAEQAAFILNEHDPRSVFSLTYWRGLVEGLWVFDVDLLVGGGAALLPVALMLAIASVCVVRRRVTVAMALVVALLGYAAWRTVGGAPDRFVMATVFLVMILAAMAAWPRRAHKLWRIGAGGLLLVAWMATVIPNRDLYRVAWYPEAWSREGMIPSRFLDSIWADVDRDDRVLLLFEARARLFPRNSEITTVWDVPPWFPLLREAEDEVGLERALADAGYTHLVVNEVEWGRLVDFYGDLDRKLAWDVFSVGLRPNDVEELLRAYPPMKHAKATDAEIARLAEWLRAMRERATMVEPMGSRAELWWAPINAGS